MTENVKQYGLLVPKKTGQCLQPRPSIFGDDSDSDTGEGANSASKTFANESVQKRQTQLDIKRALEQDPTVYQYDEVYDAMEEKKMEQRIKKKDPEKKPKYIQALLATADRRKREQERRTERKVQKEREAEGEEFKDKESFVTSAYRKKLEEFQAMDEQERLQDRLEELTDVAKQQDLSGFYRHLYRQKVCNKDESPLSAVKIKEEKKDEEESCGKRNDGERAKGTEKALFLEGVGSSDGAGKVEERQYRKRKLSSSSEAESERDGEDKRGRVEEASSRDTDTSSSSESSSGSSSESEGSGEETDGKSRVESEQKANAEEDAKERNNEASKEKKKLHDLDSEKTEEDTTTQNVDNAISESETVAEKPLGEPKPNIWEKKTVGPVFDMALQKYLARKAARMAAL